jgi:branched-chain amino acid aminotransferase
MAAIALEPPVSRGEMRGLIIEAVRRNAFANAYIKWIVTRGVNGRPLMNPTGCVANLIILVQPYINRASSERAATGLRLKTVAIRRPAGDVLDPHIKSLNYLNLVLAKIEAEAAQADEALLLDRDGRICEVSGCNIFLLHAKHLRTPRQNILRGITRDTVMEIAPSCGFSVEEADLQLYDAYTADEIIICGTAGGLLPVTAIDGRVIGSGTPGQAFATLSRAYQQAMNAPENGVAVGLELEAAT